MRATAEQGTEYIWSEKAGPGLQKDNCKIARKGVRKRGRGYNERKKDQKQVQTSLSAHWELMECD